MNYQVVAIPTKVANLVRQTRTAPGYGHPAHTEVATGYGPCRHCLQFFRVGEEQRMLFTYDPFFGIADPLPGPVFVHASDCERYSGEQLPEHLNQHPLTLVAYGEGRRLVSETKLAANASPQPLIAQLLGRSEVQYIHIRDTEAGCYDCRIERA